METRLVFLKDPFGCLLHVSVEQETREIFEEGDQN